MLSELLGARSRRVAEALASAIAARGVSANVLTIVGLGLTFVVAAVIAMGHERVGGVLLLIVAAMDTLDGALARVTRTTSTFGAFLDSLSDRYAEAAILMGLLVLFLERGDQYMPLVVYATLVGSFAVSYARARADGLGLRCEVGLLPRPERILILGLFLAIGQAAIALWLLAVLTNATAVQRVLHVWRLTRKQP